jgi:hypothetical protein
MLDGKLGRACALVAALCGCGGSGPRSAPPDPAPVNPRIDLAVFPPDNPWNLDVSQAAVDPRSSQYLASIGLTTGLHPDFGSNPAYGIPYTTVHAGQPLVPVSFDYASESDPGPYPIPPDAPVEGGAGASGDRHVVVVDLDGHMLFELFAAYPGAAGWRAGSGATWSLDSNALRPAGWTSADAAGLPILPGLVRADEVLEKKAIRHALRFTVQRTQRAYVFPARHFASSDTNPDLPPMGMRARLRASYDISAFPADCQVILQALKTYGMIVADNGSSWFISGASDPRFDDGTLHQLGQVTGADFEVVETGPLVTQ